MNLGHSRVTSTHYRIFDLDTPRPHAFWDVVESGSGRTCECQGFKGQEKCAHIQYVEGLESKPVEPEFVVEKLNFGYRLRAGDKPVATLIWLRDHYRCFCDEFKHSGGCRHIDFLKGVLDEAGSGGVDQGGG